MGVSGTRAEAGLKSEGTFGRYEAVATGDVYNWIPRGRGRTWKRSSSWKNAHRSVHTKHRQILLSGTSQLSEICPRQSHLIFPKKKVFLVFYAIKTYPVRAFLCALLRSPPRLRPERRGAGGGAARRELRLGTAPGDRRAAPRAPPHGPLPTHCPRGGQRLRTLYSE